MGGRWEVVKAAEVAAVRCVCKQGPRCFCRPGANGPAFGGSEGRGL